MKKVAFNVTRYVKNEPVKIAGIGYIFDKDLVVACLSKNDKPYVRVFEDCVKYCPEIPDKKDEHKGVFSEITEFEDRTIEISYHIWFKYIKD